LLNRLELNAVLPPNADRIRVRHLANGFKDSGYNSEPGMELGTWFCTDPEVWTAGNPALLAIDVPDDRLCAEWQSALNTAEWQIPCRYLRDLPIEVI